jgi:hypothetical protein
MVRSSARPNGPSSYRAGGYEDVVAGVSRPGLAQVSLAGRSGTKNGIFLQTFNGAGTLTDLPFHLLISC